MVINLTLAILLMEPFILLLGGFLDNGCIARMIGRLADAVDGREP